MTSRVLLHQQCNLTTVCTGFQLVTLVSADGLPTQDTMADSNDCSKEFEYDCSLSKVNLLSGDVYDETDELFKCSLSAELIKMTWDDSKNIK